MEKALLARLLAVTAVTDLFGARLNWMERPQADSQFPAATLQQIAGEPVYHSKGADPLTETLVQITVWAEKYSTAKDAAAEIKTALSGFSGTVDGVEFRGIMITGERDNRADETGDRKRLFSVELDFRFWHK